VGLFDGRSSKVPRLDFELVSGCDHKCGHCYNVWNAKAGDPQGQYPRGQLDTPAFLAMMTKAVKESGAEHLTITGGEPLLRKDALAILRHAASLVPSLQLITNGSHVTEEVAKTLAEIRVRSVQLTLLSSNRALHDRLKGAVCYDDTIRAAVELKDKGVPVQICYVAMKENAGEIEGVVDLAFAIGAVGLSYNRMSPTGWAIHEIDRLLPEVEQVEHDLSVLNRLAPRYRLHVATAMPIPPCLIRLERYPNVRFGFCSVGTESPNVTIDPLGNVRSCNLSSNILGNIRERPWSAIYPGKYVERFDDHIPEVCRGCRYEKTCRGGCKESGFAAYGDLSAPEPFLAQAFGSPSPRQKRLRVIGGDR
jgi:PqqA peptide cyclase